MSINPKIQVTIMAGVLMIVWSFTYMVLKVSSISEPWVARVW